VHGNRKIYCNHCKRGDTEPVERSEVEVAVPIVYDVILAEELHPILYDL